MFPIIQPELIKEIIFASSGLIKQLQESPPPLISVTDEAFEEWKNRDTNRFLRLQQQHNDIRQALQKEREKKEAEEREMAYFRQEGVPEAASVAFMRNPVSNEQKLIIALRAQKKTVIKSYGVKWYWIKLLRFLLKILR